MTKRFCDRCHDEIKGNPGLIQLRSPGHLKILHRNPIKRASNYPRGAKKFTWSYKLEDSEPCFSTKKEAREWRDEIIAAGAVDAERLVQDLKWLLEVDRIAGSRLLQDNQRLRSVIDYQGRRDELSQQVGAPFDEDLQHRLEAGHA